MVIITMILAAIFSCLDRNYGYFYGMFIALFILWGEGFRWSSFGFGKKITPKTLINSLIITILIAIVMNIFIEPFLELYFGRMDLSSLDDIRGNFVGYVIILFISWTFAAFGEEFLFRGYYMKRLAELLGDSDKAWLISAIIVSIYFGVSHFYQGPAGMIAVTLVGFCFAMIFYKNRDNLVLAVLVHGFYNMLGLTLIFLNKERVIADWMEQLFISYFYNN